VHYAKFTAQVEPPMMKDRKIRADFNISIYADQTVGSFPSKLIISQLSEADKYSIIF
jgi:hypothetical protein